MLTTPSRAFTVDTLAPPTVSPMCQDGEPCQTPPGGGACSKCAYPIACAHPSSVLGAFRVEAIWIDGTAITVQSDSTLRPGDVHIHRRDGSFDVHRIPEGDDSPSPPSIPENESQSPGGLDKLLRIHLLGTAARLLCGSDRSPSELSLSAAIVEGIAALSHCWLSAAQRNVLERFERSDAEDKTTVHAVRALLREVDRLDRLERSITGPGLTVDDNRPNLAVACAAIGEFSAPLSRLRIALLPGEADYVDLYDVRVGACRDYPIGTSVISRLPGYGPATIRETPDRVDIGGTFVGTYLPGSALAGQLRDGADLTYLAGLSPNDLLGGVEFDLGRTFPPMSFVYLFYRVAPGHVFCAVVEPIEPQIAPEAAT